MKILDTIASGRLIRQYREENNYMNKQFVQLIGQSDIDKSWLSAAEHGKLKPTEINVRRFEEIAKLTGIELCYIDPNNKLSEPQVLLPHVRRSPAISRKKSTMNVISVALACSEQLKALTLVQRQLVLDYLNEQYNRSS